jgi:hypothetical protein
LHMSEIPRKHRYSVPITMGQAAEMIDQLRLSIPDKEDLLTIRNVCGSEFANALAELMNGENTDQAKNLVHGVLGACADSTRKYLQSMGFSVPACEKMALIGKTEGRKFYISVQRAAKGTLQSEFSRDYVAKILARFSHEDGDNAHHAAPEHKLARGHALELPPAEPVASTRRTVESNIPPVPNLGEDGEYQSVHVFGTRYAICFSATLTRKGNKPTISLDAAPAKLSSSALHGKADIDWDSKIIVQFSEGELLMVLAVLTGHLDRFEASGHGKYHEKWCKVERQPGKVYVSVGAKGITPCGVPITPTDLFPVIRLVTKQLLAASPHMTPSMLMAHVQNIAVMAKEGANA